MSWQSTQTYYRLINEGVAAELGGLHSANLLLSSIDFAPLEKLQAVGDWQAAANLLIAKAQGLEAGGAEALMICTNTMHKVADQVASSINIPLLHIADATGRYLVNASINRVGLLGTAFTMEQGFYKDRLREHFGLDVRVPDSQGRALVHRIIYEELCLGVVTEDSRQEMLTTVAALQQGGAEAIILGCTEIGLLLKQGDTAVQLVDTTEIHAAAGVAFILHGEG